MPKTSEGNNYIETKRLTLFVIAFLCSPVSVGGLISTYFWCSVLYHSGDYVSAAFQVDEVSYQRFTSKHGCVVASGKIAGSDEILYSWKDYFSKEQSSLQKGRRLPVMFNSKATHFHYSYRNLRVLSLRDYNLAARNVISAFAVNAVSPIMWIIYLRYAQYARKAEEE